MTLDRKKHPGLRSPSVLACLLAAGAALSVCTAAVGQIPAASAASAAAAQEHTPFWQDNAFYDLPAHWSKGVFLWFTDDTALRGLSDQQIIDKYAGYCAQYGVVIAGVDRVSAHAVTLQFDHALHPSKTNELGRAIQAGDGRIRDFDELVPRQVGIDRAPAPDESPSTPKHKLRYDGKSTIPGAKSFPTPDNDSNSNQQWALWSPTGGINLSGSRAITGGDGKVIAQLDTGYVPHEDLKGHILQGYDFISDPSLSGDGDGRDADATDPGGGCRDFESAWHGTRTAGVAAAVTNNGLGMSGVAANASVVPVRVYWPCSGSASVDDIAAAVRWSAGQAVKGVPKNAFPATVVSMSVEGSGNCPAVLANAISDARDALVPVVVGAGNDGGQTAKHWPANCQYAITVAGNANNGYSYGGSNTGPEVALSAPSGTGKPGQPNCDNSVCVMAPSNSNYTNASAGDWNYPAVIGTSYSAPEVAGVVALMLWANPSLTPDQVRSHLTGTARPFPGTCTGCGAGIVDASAAVAVVNDHPTLVDEAEGNAKKSKAQVLTDDPVRVAGRLNITEGNDWYKVSVPPRHQLTVVLSPQASTGLALALEDSKDNVLDQGQRTAAGAVDTVHMSNTDQSAAKDVWVHITYAQGTVGSYTLDLVD